ncbi:MAG: hypothetical protein AAF447_06505 [Myxococcota bacterium]
MTESDDEGSGYRKPSRPVVAEVLLHDGREGEPRVRLTVFSDQSAELHEAGRPPRRFGARELRVFRRAGGFGPVHVERLELRTRDGRAMVHVPADALAEDELRRVLDTLGGTLEHDTFVASAVEDRHRRHLERLGPAPLREEPVVLEGHRPISPLRGPLALLLSLATLVVAASTALPRFNVLTVICLASGLLIAAGVGFEGLLRRFFPQRKRLERRGQGVVMVDARGRETPVDAMGLRLGTGDPDEGLGLTLAGRDGDRIFQVDRASREEVQAIRGLLAGARRAVRARVAVDGAPQEAETVAAARAAAGEREA